MTTPGSASAPPQWEHLDELTRHIVDTHHRYVRQTCPVIMGWLDTLATTSAEAHPELADVRATFSALRDELTSHMLKEENVLFPFIDELAIAIRSRTRPPAGPFGTILHPVRVMESEHESALELLEHVRSLTNGYTPPAGASQTHRACYEELAKFAADLDRHIHLENTVLFPKALELENRWV